MSTDFPEHLLKIVNLVFSTCYGEYLLNNSGLEFIAPDGVIRYLKTKPQPPGAVT